MASADTIPLNLLSPAQIAPRLLRTAALFALGGVVAGFVAYLFVPAMIAIIIGLVVGLPVVIVILLTLRARIMLSGTVIHERRAFFSHKVDVAEAVTVELSVRTARVNLVILRIGDGRNFVTIPLAMYLDDAGRELPVRALRGVADALDASELVPAAAMASVLVQQLRAEARDAVLGERPLYRAMRLALDAARSSETTLTDAEVAGLVD